MTIRNKLIVLLVLCCYTTVAQAQKQRYKAALETVPETGFYELTITTELSACLKADLADLRIADDKGQVVPYIIRNSRYVAPNVPFTELPMLENKVIDSGRSQIILQHKAGTGIRTLLIVAGNTTVRRRASLSGSDDRKNWYIINDDLLLEPSFPTGTSDQYMQQAGIPVTTYTYLKLVVDNEHADPVNIIRIGIPTDEMDRPQPRYTFQRNPDARLTQKDSSDGNSYITLYSDKPYHTDLLHPLIASPRFYDRQVTVLAPANDTTEHCGACYEVGRFNLNSAGKNGFELNRFKSRVMVLVIENKDNPPMKIREVMTFQRTYSAVAWLEKGKNYHILAGDPAATRPQYDLEKFTDSIPAHIRNLHFGAVTDEKNDRAATVTTASGGRKAWLWATIIAAVFLLSVFTWRLMKDMKKKGL